jgi:hypothetical protein
MVVHKVTHLDTVPPGTMRLFEKIERASFRRYRVLSHPLLTNLSYRDVYELYRMVGLVEHEPRLVSSVRSILTRYCKARYRVHPSPRFSLSVPARFGLSRDACRDLCFALIRDVEVPPVVRERVIADMPISFTSVPSVGESICNFRSYCKDWSHSAPWKCTCESLMTTCGISGVADNFVQHSHAGRHLNAKFSACSGRHAVVFGSNLNDRCIPASSSIAQDLIQPLYKFLHSFRSFACAIRKCPIPDFHLLRRGRRPRIRVSRSLSPVVDLVLSMGFTFNHLCLRALEKIERSEVSFAPSTPTTVPSTDQVSAFSSAMAKPGAEGVVMYLDKNSGMGAVVCPHLYWWVLHDALWSNPDYERTLHTSESLHVLHYKSYLAGDWGRAGPYVSKGTPANAPFLFTKNKSNAKYRPVLSAFSHCLRRVHARVASALRFCLMSVTGDGAFDMNLHTTLETPAAFRRLSRRCLDTLASRGVRATGVDCYAGDVSSMFDKLPCDVVMRAVDFVLQQASHSSSGYRLRSSCRSSVTLNLDSDEGHHIGLPPVPNERLVSLPFALLVDVCSHYCFHTYFEFGSMIFRLALGIPQGGSLSDPLSKIYCIYCEHAWRSSIFDSTKFDAHTGMIRPCDLSDHGRRTLSAIAHIPLLPSDTTPLVCGFFRRYADDCRATSYFNASDPRGVIMADALITSYKTDCYIKPCELEDEERGSSFHFLQGFFQFSSGGCDASYVHKNAPFLLGETQGELRTIQHYWSYGQSNRALRLATLCGKFCEIRHFCSDATRTIAAVLSLCLELKSLQYPVSVVRDALFRQTARTSDAAWTYLSRHIRAIYRTI